jgi:hypothetical protein
LDYYSVVSRVQNYIDSLCSHLRFSPQNIPITN